MPPKKSRQPKPAELQPFSRTLNKTRMAAIMGVFGLAVVAIAHYFLGPQWTRIALAVFLVGITSALVSVGGTYRGGCPHCGAQVVYAHTLGARSFKCRNCGKKIVLNKVEGGFAFRRS